MSVKILTVGSFQVNCYIVQPEPSSNTVFVIDPGDEGQRIVNYLEDEGLKPAAILLTHAHLDHIKGCATVAKHFAIKVFVPDADVTMFLSDDNELAPWLYRDCEFPEPIALSKAPDFGFEVIETPGHTLGGVCYYFKTLRSLFSGDTLFRLSIGRTDLPGGCHNSLVRSVKENLFCLPGNTVVYPGHGPESSIGDEKRMNSFIR